MNFTTTVTDVSIYGLREYLKLPQGIDVTDSSYANISFELQFEAREYGLKSISIVIKFVAIDIQWEVQDDDLTIEDKKSLIGLLAVERSGTFVGNLIITDKDLEVVNEMEFQSDGAISVQDVEVDFEKMTIRIS